MNIPINAPDKCVCCQEPNRARQKPVHSTSQQAVAKEQHARNEPLNIKFSKIVPGTVKENPESTASTDEEGLPPPVVVLRDVSTSVDI